MNLKKNTFENIVGKGENISSLHFLSSHNVFYPIHNKLNFFVTFILSTVIAFNFNQAEILSFDNGLTLYQTTISYIGPN